jgi:hypothetical protein
MQCVSQIAMTVNRFKLNSSRFWRRRIFFDTFYDIECSIIS